MMMAISLASMRSLGGRIPRYVDRVTVVVALGSAAATAVEDDELLPTSSFATYTEIAQVTLYSCSRYSTAYFGIATLISQCHACLEISSELCVSESKEDVLAIREGPASAHRLHLSS
jgi:hypothetical protein